MAYYGSFTATSQGSRLDHSVDKGPGKKGTILWPKWVCDWHQGIRKVLRNCSPCPSPYLVPWPLGLVIKRDLMFNFRIRKILD